VLNADVGGVDTGNLEGGRSNAQLADEKNPHPEGHPLYEYTWKTVFLHSLVGQEGGRDSKAFGLTEPEAQFAVAFPGLTPPQVRTALEEIERSAFYLRHDVGKYFASKEPTINSILAKIRRTLVQDDIDNLLEATARKIITGGSGPFQVEHDVTLPEHLPDNTNKPVLGVVPPTARTVDIHGMVTTKGPNRPRTQQNLIFVLVPETVRVTGLGEEQESLFGEDQSAWELRERVSETARQVKAMQVLADRPDRYGLSPRRIEDDDFRRRYRERGNGLVTAVSSMYTSLYFPSTRGEITREGIRSGGGEGGLPIVETILTTLREKNELLSTGAITRATVINLRKLFFAHDDTTRLQKLLENFYCLRQWPVLEEPGVFEEIIRAGVQRGEWCVFFMGDETSVCPTEFYHRDDPLPMNMDLESKDYGLVTVPGAKQRGWLLVC